MLGARRRAAMQEEEGLGAVPNFHECISEMEEKAGGEEGSTGMREEAVARSAGYRLLEGVTRKEERRWWRRATLRRAER